MTDILQRIVTDKRAEVAAAKAAVAPAEMTRRAADVVAPRDFFATMVRPSETVRVIAEIKRASPSAGLIRPDFDPLAIARAYASHGAAAISCLTDEPYFQGDLATLAKIKAEVDLPVLRKDFIIDPYQIDQSRAAGADAILLIAECLDHATLAALVAKTLAWSMTVLLEVYERVNLERVAADLNFGGASHDDGMVPVLLGVNNRNLRTMTTDLGHSLEMLDLVEDPNRFVSESGIRTHADVVRLREAGVNSVLVGEHLMRQPDVGAALKALMHGD